MIIVFNNNNGYDNKFKNKNNDKVYTSKIK